MYNPPQFRESDPAAIRALLTEIGFGTLVTYGAEGLAATPVPMVYAPEDGEFGTLYGHISRGNPQWRTTDAAVEALALFVGPQGYISPSWYETKKTGGGKVVPTWNYVAVEARGILRFISDAQELLPLVTDLTRRHEAGRAEEWAVGDAPAEYIAGQLKGIVGFALTVTKLDGKRKLSQNRAAVDRAGVVDGLAAAGEETLSRLVAEADPDRLP